MSDTRGPLDRVTRIIAEAAALPDRPIGRHLQEDQLSALAQGRMSAGDQERTFTHFESCMRCAERAEQAFAAIELTDDRPEMTRIEAPAAADAEAIPRELLQLAWLPVIAVAAVQAQRLGVRGLLTRTTQALTQTVWSQTSEPSLLCAVENSLGQVTLSLRTENDDWAETPVRCVVLDDATGQIWSEAWLLLHRGASGENGDAVELESGVGPLPEGVRVAVGKCALNPRSAPAPDELAELRRSIAKSGGTSRSAWMAWLDRQVAAGLMTDRMRAMLRPES